MRAGRVSGELPREMSTTPEARAKAREVGDVKPEDRISLWSNSGSEKNLENDRTMGYRRRRRATTTLPDGTMIDVVTGPPSVARHRRSASSTPRRPVGGDVRLGLERARLYFALAPVLFWALIITAVLLAYIVLVGGLLGLALIVGVLTLSASMASLGSPGRRSRLASRWRWAARSSGLAMITEKDMDIRHDPGDEHVEAVPALVDLHVGRTGSRRYRFARYRATTRRLREGRQRAGVALTVQEDHRRTGDRSVWPRPCRAHLDSWRGNRPSIHARRASMTMPEHSGWLISCDTPVSSIIASTPGRHRWQVFRSGSVS